MSRPVELERASPLLWPAGWPRTAFRRRAKFKSTFGQARDGLAGELDRLGARSVVLSSNLELRLDGQPYAGRPNPGDPGVAVYFTLPAKRGQPGGKRLVLACDVWDRVEHNVHAVELHVGALRGMDRWGVGSVEQAFAGYAALPAPGEHESRRPWREVFGVSWAGPAHFDDETVAEKFRELARSRHPDADGSAAAFAELARARDEALAERRLFLESRT